MNDAVDRSELERRALVAVALARPDAQELVERLKKPRHGRPPPVVAGGREALERELLWAIALGGDRQRIEILERMLTPASNDPTPLTVLGPGPGSE
jgi:hypothetical protein